MKKRLSIGVMIISESIIAMCFATLLLFISVQQIVKNSRVAEVLYSHDLVGLRYTAEMENSIEKVASSVLYAILFYEDDTKVSNYKNDYNTYFNNFTTNLDNLGKLAVNEREKSFHSDITTLITKYRKISDNCLSLVDQKLQDEATLYFAENAMPLRKGEIAPLLNSLSDYITKSGDEQYEAMLIATNNSKLFLDLLLIALDFVALGIAIVITTMITKPIKEMVNTLGTSSSQIEISSNQLSSASQQIAIGAQQQAASVEETSASLEELSSMVKQNLETIKKASLLSEQGTTANEEGSIKMAAVNEAMHKIAKSTDEINNVIDIIDDIAFQTNMLALNAAVEAARAGEAGMGFAVVADEVKNLANRSSASAKDTTTMIKETIKNIKIGLQYTDELSAIFAETLSNSRAITEMNHSVVEASEQQSEGIEQVNKAMIQFDSVIQSNATSAEATANSAEELHSQMDTMSQVVDRLYNVVTGKIK